ncbi:U3 snoRNP-associated protein Esf2 [Schizosaccharomyces cryophilus OY26]|uniref:18S rRNA factor 2 n=1 Tax=Schizosaccharomyces cryophilus (strain OY26 / ATCC MYA-4695 / CBS 11777 / NBRC 106824 / NRRL Y48691) TaxID=653667 RepID=S9W4R9_SCHCR|nr:U3 snoRNP-associated protein Esf2 [Schizosaccharomyces cryophilus OY26]EPY52910.1 U3 snoRNP-associated protein Esf2 [Schizosaccharomyces cryophilus OY26]
MSEAAKFFGAVEEEDDRFQHFSSEEEDNDIISRATIRSSRNDKSSGGSAYRGFTENVSEEDDNESDEEKNERYNAEDNSDVELYTGGDFDEENDKENAKAIKSEKPLNKISLEEVEKKKKATKRSGVIYLSKVPPYMAPNKLRQLLSQYGKIGRIYLAPESAQKRAKRLKGGGNKRTMYEEGWVEFESKRVAKTVAEMLNTEKIGGKKTSWYYDDIWNMKYLPKFKWHHLTEQIAAENAARASRLKVEIEQGRKQVKEYMKNVERAKMIEGIQKKRKERTASSEVPSSNNDTPVETGPSNKEMRRFFDQKSVTNKRVMPKNENEQRKVENVLNKVL